MPATLSVVYSQMFSITSFYGIFVLILSLNVKNSQCFFQKSVGEQVWRAELLLHGHGFEPSDRCRTKREPREVHEPLLPA